MIQEVQKQNHQEKFYLDALTMECMPHPIRNPTTPIPRVIKILNGSINSPASFIPIIEERATFKLIKNFPSLDKKTNTKPTKKTAIKANTNPTQAPHILKGLKLFFAILTQKITTYINLLFLNKYSNRENLNFANAIFCYAENDIICVKEFAKYSFFSPKFFATQKTFLNANIMPNLWGNSKS